MQFNLWEEIFKSILFIGFNWEFSIINKRNKRRWGGRGSKREDFISFNSNDFTFNRFLFMFLL
jgi:hypothetical protein